MAAARRFSALGEYGLLWGAIGVAGMALDAPRRARWRRGVVTVYGAHAVASTIKLAVRRRRPEVEGLPALTGTPTGLTFPSTHATTSFAGATAYGTLVPSMPLFALATAMALSRLYLGVHYPSDVVAGATLGAAIGSALR